MKQYRKTYKPFIAWMLAMFIGLPALSLLPAPFGDGACLTRLTLLATLLALDALMALIYFGESVYWINGGPTFEQARDAGSRARKAYAWAHLKRFLIGTGAAIAAMIAAHMAALPVWVDFISVCLAMVVAALSTMGIKFQP